jgi:hypothetical protein
MQGNSSRGLSRGSGMWFLLKSAFWLGLVLVLLPIGGTQPAPKVQVSAFDAMSAAKAAVSDMNKFCERQPDACVIGGQTAVALGQRAQVGAKMLYEFLNEQLGPSEASVTSTIPMPPAKASHHTLTPADLAPAWRKP